MEPRWIVTRGDDAASFPGANAAMVDAARHGVLRNVGIMACCPAFDDAVARLRDLPGVALGLHITLNSEWDAPRFHPVLPRDRVPSLVEADGGFTREPRILQDRGASLDEAMDEIRAQLARLRAAGIRPAYIDEHMGVGWIGGSQVPGHGWVGGLRRRIARLAREEGLVDGLRVRGLAIPKDGPDLVARWIAGLEALEPGTAALIVTHPGFDDADLRALRSPFHAEGAVAAERDGDRRAWSDPRLREAAARLNVRFVRYDEVPAELLRPSDADL